MLQTLVQTVSFSDHKGIVNLEFLEQGCTVNHCYYLEILGKLLDATW